MCCPYFFRFDQSVNIYCTLFLDLSIKFCIEIIYAVCSYLKAACFYFFPCSSDIRRSLLGNCALLIVGFCGYHLLSFINNKTVFTDHPEMKYGLSQLDMLINTFSLRYLLDSYVSVCGLVIWNRIEG